MNWYVDCVMIITNWVFIDIPEDIVVTDPDDKSKLMHLAIGLYLLYADKGTEDYKKISSYWTKPNRPL